MTGYWLATILLAERVSIERRNAAVRIPYRWFFGSLAAIVLLGLIALAHLNFGIFQPSTKPSLLGFLPIQTDPTTQIFDLQQLRQGFVKNSNLNLALKQADFVFTNNPNLSGQLGMAIAPIFAKQITCFDPNPRGFAFWSKPTQWIGKNAIYMSTKTTAADLDAQHPYASYFQTLTKLGEIPIYRGPAIIQTFSVYQAKKMLKPFPRHYGN